MDPVNLKKLNESRLTRRAAVLVTYLDDGRDRLVVEGETVIGPLGAEIGQRLLSGRSGLVDLEGRSFLWAYRLPVLPEPDYVGVNPDDLPYDET